MKSFFLILSAFVLLWLLLFPRLIAPDAQPAFFDAVLGEPARAPYPGRTFAAGESCTLYIPSAFVQLPTPAPRADGYDTLGVFEGSDGFGRRARITVLERRCELTDLRVIREAYASRYADFRVIERDGALWLAGSSLSSVSLWRANGKTLCRIELRAQDEAALRSDGLRELLSCAVFSLQEPDTPAEPDAAALHAVSVLRGERPVSFASKDFELLLRIAMRKQPGEPFYPGELAAVRCLHLSPRSATLSPWASALPERRGEDVLTAFSLEDLRHFTALEQLSVSCVTLEGLDALSSLPLSSLSLTVCGLTEEDCAPLHALGQLHALDLSLNDLRDLSFLSGMTALETLSLSFNPVSSIAPLALLPRLERLDLSATFAGSLEPLAGLDALAFLDLSMVSSPEPEAAPLSLLPLAGLDSLRAADLFRVQADPSTLAACAARIPCVTGLPEPPYGDHD